MSQSDNSKLVFGYWALRGKAHVIRLLMQHLKIPYQEVIYKTPQSWYNEPLSKENRLIQLPYIKDKGFVVDGTVPVIIYILKKYGHQNLLGTSLQDQACVDMHQWSMENTFKKIISLSHKNTDSIEQMIQMKEELWEKTIKPKLQSIENFLTPNNWCLGYLTVIDFDLYQFMHYLRILYPSKIVNFPKIQVVQRRISELSEIRKYNNSQKFKILCSLPIQMCKRFKAQPQPQNF